MANVTSIGISVIDSGDVAYIPFEIYTVLLFITILFFFYSITSQKPVARFAAIVSTILFFVLAMLTWAIEFHGVAVETLSDTIYIIPYALVVHPPYLSILLYGFALAALINTYYLWFRQTVETVGANVP